MAEKTTKTTTKIPAPNAVTTTHPEKKDAVLVKADPKTVLALLCIVTSDDEKVRKTAPGGWASQAALDANMSAIKGESTDFIQKYKQFKSDTVSIALHIFFAREQYKEVHKGSTDMNFIGEYFDPAVKTMKQAEANKTSEAYQCMQYLFTQARKAVTAEVERRVRQDRATKHTALLTSAQKEMSENGELSQQIKQSLQIAGTAQGLKIPLELAQVMDGKEVEPEKLEDAIAKATEVIAAEVVTPPSEGNKSGNTTEPVAQAIANHRLIVCQLFSDTTKTVSQKIADFTAAEKTLLEGIYKGLGRMQFDSPWKRSGELFEALLVGAVSGEPVTEVPSDTRKVG